MRRKLAPILAGLATLALLSACGSAGRGSAGQTGGVAAQVIWPDGSGVIAPDSLSSQSAAGAHPLTAPPTVTTMRFIVTGSGMTQMQQDFGASAGTGTMTGIPVGTGRTLTINGLNSAGVTQYVGSSATFSVTASADSAVTVNMGPASGVAAAPWSPSNVAALAGNSQVTVSWSSVTGASSYNLYWGTATGVTTSSTNKILGVSSAYVHTSLINGTKYFYIVTATNSVGESPASKEASATPSSSTTTGTLTIFLSNASAVGTVTVRVDGAVVGSFTSHWISGFPTTCGLNDAATLTMVTSAGVHSITAADSGNLTWGPFSISVPGGGCFVFNLF